MNQVIGIGCWVESRQERICQEINNYFAENVEKAGGIPVMLPVTEDEKTIEKMVQSIDGLLLIGGEDVSPFHYGDEPSWHLQKINPERDRTEMILLEKAMKKKIPIFGICRGLQIINVYLGGKNYQDIYTEVEHVMLHSNRQPVFDVKYHSVFSEQDSFLEKLYGPSLIVNSFHHQAIKVLGQGLRVAGRSRDQIIEAFESTNDTVIIGVQFHPEFTKHNPDFQKLFDYFVNQVRMMKTKTRKITRLYIKDNKVHPIGYLKEMTIGMDGIAEDYRSHFGHFQIAILDEGARSDIDSLVEETDHGFCTRRYQENITISNLGIHDLQIGMILSIGKVKIRLLEVGKRCYPECPLVTEKKYCPLLHAAVAFGEVVSSGRISIGQIVSLE